MTRIQPGMIASVDLTVSDADRIRDFYQSVIGWTHMPLDMGGYADYMMMANDQPAGGICHKRGVNAALPSHWMVYFIVSDMNASLQTVERLGGRILIRPQNNEGTRYAVIQDPAGAICALYEVAPVDEAGMTSQLAGIEAAHSQPGHMAWVDLTVEDAETARDFYQQVIGWTSQTVPQEEGAEAYDDYNMCTADGTARTGICHRRGMNAMLPSQWMVYFVVPDVDQSIRAVEAGGGSVIRSPEEGGGGRIAVIQDPAGAVCSLFEVTSSQTSS